MFDFGWFSSGRDQAALDLFTATLGFMENGFIPGRIAYVFCDRELGESEASDAFLAAVAARGIPLVTHSSRPLRHLIKSQNPDLDAARKAFDAKVIGLLHDFPVQVVVLAGYMLITSPLLCQAFLCLNLHPALPGGPKGTWQEVMWQLMATGAREAGGMMHLATPELDAGPPVTFCKFPLRGPDFNPLWEAFQEKLTAQSLEEIRAREGESEPLFARLREEELRREFPLIILTLKNLAEERFHLTREGVQVEGRLLPHGCDLTSQVEAFLQ